MDVMQSDMMVVCAMCVSMLYEAYTVYRASQHSTIRVYILQKSEGPNKLIDSYNMGALYNPSISLPPPPLAI